MEVGRGGLGIFIYLFDDYGSLGLSFLVAGHQNREPARHLDSSPEMGKVTEGESL